MRNKGKVVFGNKLGFFDWIYFVLVAIAVIIWVLYMTVRTDAQVGVSQRAWQYGTAVTVWNDTADQSPVNVFVDGTRTTKLALRHGERWSHSFGSGAFLFYTSYYSMELNISAQICEEIKAQQFTIAPPEWATDQVLLGGIALTHEYLLSGPSEKEVKERVREIKNSIRGRLGHKAMGKELDEWFNAVKKIGLGFSGETCIGPITRGAKLQIYGDSYNNQRRSTTVYIRGDREHGYRLEGPDGYVY